MSHINREGILKGFLDKVREAKKLQMKEVKIPIRELDDLAYIIYQMMSEEVSMLLNSLDKKEETPKVVEKPISRKVLSEVHIVKKTNVEDVKKEENVEIQNNTIKEDNDNDNNNLVDDEEDNGNTLYGGTW